MSRALSFGTWNREVTRVTGDLAAGCRRIALGFSGGTDSLILAKELLAQGAEFRLICLATKPESRDAKRAAECALNLGRDLQLVLVTDDALRAAVARHAALLGSLADTTQRVLAVAESLLADAAVQGGATQLWTGHGPEAVLGGFHRRPVPEPGDVERMEASLGMNAWRLNAVASTHRDPCLPFLHPFLHPSILAAAHLLRASGFVHEDLATQPAARKASFQNGSAILYRLEKLARADGCRTLTAWLNTRLGFPSPVPVS